MRTAIIAALPRELRSLVDGWDQVRGTRPGVLLYERGSTLAACAGIGGSRAALAVEAVMSRALSEGSAVDQIISFGLAGACDPALRAGDVLWCGPVVDARSGERFDSEAEGALLVSGVAIANRAEKQRLRASYNAVMVDMEAASVGRLARAHGVRFRALKAVSDAAKDEMDGMNEFVTRTGAFREVAYALHTALRPARWRAAVALGRASAIALRAGRAELLPVLDEEE